MSASRVVETGSVEETLRLAADLAGELPGGSVLLLSGELGAGKTHFVKGLARGLGLDEDETTSPTFTIVQVQESEGGLGLVHVDLYRLADPSELPELGLDELPGPGRVAAVEWPDRLGGVEPEGCWRVCLEELGVERRRIRIEPPPVGSRPPGRVT